MNKHGILKGFLGAALVASAINGFLFFVADQTGNMPGSARNSFGQQVTAWGVIAATVAGIAGATATYAFLRKRFGVRNRVFLPLSGAAFALSCLGPLTLGGAPPLMVGFLLLMHLAAALTAVYCLYLR